MTRTFMLQELISNLVLLCVCYVLCVVGNDRKTTHCPQVLRAKHLWTMSVFHVVAHLPRLAWTPPLSSTGASREAPVDNECFSRHRPLA